jgi:hypothetical protein
MAARDVIFAGAILFILAIGFFIITFTSNTITNALTTNERFNESQQAVDAMESANTAVQRSDYVFLGVFFALMLGLVITGWFIGGIPIFMFIYFLVTVVAVVFAAIGSNIWQAITPASVFGTTVSLLPITNHILSYLPFYVALFGTIGVIVMFAKPEENVYGV